MKQRHNCLVMVIMPLFHLKVEKKIGRPRGGAKMVHFESFGHHGKLLVVFGF